MTGIYVFLMLAGFAGFIAFMFWLNAHIGRKWLEKLGEVSRRFPGMEVVPGTWLSQPHLRHAGSGWSAFVSFWGGSKNSPPYTRVEFQLEKAMPSLRLAPQHFFSGIAKFFGAQDIEIGVPEWDARFMIAANPPAFAREFLDPNRRQLIDGIRESAGTKHLSLEVNGHLARVSVAVCLRDVGTISRYLTGAFAFADSIAGAGGVQVVELSTGKGTCLVCGQEMAGAVVRCRKCATPHHRECWDYLGACATFACGSNRTQ